MAVNAPSNEQRGDRNIKNSPGGTYHAIGPNKDLLLLIKIERHEGELYRGEGKRIHTVAFAQITKTLELEYFKGRVNYPWILRVRPESLLA